MKTVKAKMKAVKTSSEEKSVRQANALFNRQEKIRNELHKALAAYRKAVASEASVEEETKRGSVLLRWIRADVHANMTIAKSAARKIGVK